MVHFYRTLTGVFLVALSALSLAHGSSQSRFQGFVQATSKHELYIDYQKPGAGQPTLLLINGLTYDTTSWNRFAEALKPDTFGILRIDLMGQGQTLYKTGIPLAPIYYQEQVADIAAVMDRLKITEPVHLVSLSYGGALALVFAQKYPQRLASNILMAPFTEPIAEQDKMIRQQIQATRIMFPFNPASDDELYDYFLRQIVYSTYPSAEPVILEHPYKLESVYRLVQGARKFLAAKIMPQIQNSQTHLIIARRDQYLQAAVLEKFWSLVPASSKMSLLYMEDTEHKIPEDMPGFSAAWVKLIVRQDPRLQKNVTYTGQPRTGEAKSVADTIRDLPRY